MTDFVITVVYRRLWRLCVLACGVVAIILGYRLFMSGWFIPQAESWRSTIAPFLQTHPSVIVVLIVSLALPLFWLFLWKLPQWQVTAVPEGKDRIDLEWKSRQILAQIVGGAAVLSGIYFTAQTLRTAQETLKVNQETLRTTQQGQITDRFTKAVAQLGHQETLAIRLGGIYALERIARDSEADHWAVMEVLTAFVREHPGERPPKPKTVWTWIQPQTSCVLPEQDELKPPPDMQAVLTTIGRRTRTWQQGETQPINLSHSQFQGANLHGAHLEKANLQGAHLEEADFRGAHLKYADFVGAHLKRANLGGVPLEEANFEGARLEEACLVGARLTRAQFVNARLDRAILARAQLEKTSLLGVDLRYTIGLTQSQIDMACLDDTTQLPEGLTRPPPCF
jgi:hypothetical protein